MRSVKKAERTIRPSYPSVGRQWQGILLVVITIGCIEVAYAQVGSIKSPGNILLLITLLVTYWSGLRAGMIASGIAYVYLLYRYSIPGEILHYAPDFARRLISAAILFPLLTLLVGSIQGRLRNAATREYDALQEVVSETANRHRTEEALRSREDLWGLVVNSAMDGIIAMEEDGRIMLWNPNAEAIFGWKDDEIIGKSLGETIVPPAYREAHGRGLQRFLETGEASIFGKRLELFALAKDGREFPIELTVVHHQTADHPIFIGFVRDMTEQTKLNERLRQAQKMEAIGTLAGGIAHDFNNILAAVSGNLMLVRSDIPSTDPVQESLGEIEKAVSRATYLVRQILTFSRAKEINAQVIDLRETLPEAIKLLQAAIPASMQIEAHIEDNVPSIVADITDIHQIVLNLGINAYQAMKGHSGKFEVQVSPITLDDATAESLFGIAPGQYVRISLGDTGCGMDTQTLQRMYEPFFTTKALGEGTGLGLSVVYGIVERHQGAITAYSEPKKGTIFHIYFPAAETVLAPPERKPTETWAGHGERILYVDDDEALVFMMRRMLSRLNYNVVGYQHPREALDAFQADPDGFDLVITDMSMPYMDGPALAQQLHAIRPGLPIVMVTGYIRPQDLDLSRELGIRELILKPNTVHEMSEVLYRILEDLNAKKESPTIKGRK